MLLLLGNSNNMEKLWSCLYDPCAQICSGSTPAASQPVMQNLWTQVWLVRQAHELHQSPQTLSHLPSTPSGLGPDVSPHLFLLCCPHFELSGHPPPPAPAAVTRIESPGVRGACLGGALWGVTEGKEGVRSCGAWAPEPTQRKPAFAWDYTSSCHPLTGTAPATCNLPITERSAGTCAPSWPYPASRTCAISQTLPLLLLSSLTRAAMST